MKLLYLANIRFPTEKAHGVQIMKMCEAFARAGVEVELAVPNLQSDIPEDPFSYYAITTRFPITRLPVLECGARGRIRFYIQTFSFALSALFFLRKRSCDVIYGRDEVVLLATRVFGWKKTVWEAHGYFNVVVRRMLRTCPLIVVTSRGIKDFYSAKGSRARILIAPNGIDLGDFTPPTDKGIARRRLGLPLDAYIAMYIGRLDGWKGVQTFCEAADFLTKDIILVAIGGEPDQVPTMKKRYPKIIFLGFKPYRDLAHNQAAADVLVLPNTGKDEISRSRTSPLKLFSYMASGRPIVASDLPSTGEIIGPASARLVQADNPRALAEGILALSRNPAEAERLSHQAFRDVAAYSWTRRARNILDFISASA